MRFLNIAFLSLLISGVCYAITPDKVVNGTPGEVNNIILNDNYFKILINGVNEGNTEWLNAVPYVSGLIKPEQSNVLMDALIHALINSPADTLYVLEKIDEKIAIKGHSPVRDKLGTDSICSYMINTDKYDRASFFEYYKKAEARLKGLGNKGENCLEAMNASVEETLYEEKRGRLKWGTEQYPF